MNRRFGLVFMLLCMHVMLHAQDNAPYSRYGIGDLVANQNIINRAMGGISAGYSDYLSVNFSNPATYGNLSYISDKRFRKTSVRSTIFDIGGEISSRTLKSTTPNDRYSNTNPLMSYLQMGIPLKFPKANAKNLFVGMAFGLRPVSKIGYKIYKTERLAGVDSLATFYEGSGGVNEANLGLGIRYKNLNIGGSMGYRFGSRDYRTQLLFLNDSVNYYQSNSSSKSNFSGLVFSGGIQYEINFKNNARLRLGGTTTLGRTLKGTFSTLRETIELDAEGATFRIDSVYESKKDGTVKLPTSFSFGFTYQDSAGNWLVGADYEKVSWSQFRYDGQPDQVADNWKIRVGAEYYPAKYNTSFKKYFNHVRYRAGFHYGPDYLNLGNNRLNEFAFTLGAGFPLRLRRSYYETQVSYLNTAIEIGNRSNKNANLKESYFRICLGLSLSDIWFNRSKYY